MFTAFSDRRIGITANQSSIAARGSVRANVENTKVNVSRSLDRRIEVVVMLLESNSHQQIGIEEMARLVNLSPGRLAHLFKSEMDLSVQQYLTQLRLAKARRQLESSFLSIKEIAASVGFPSVARFVVCFKNVVGATPAHYRKHFVRLHTTVQRSRL
jgi:transcriptional regulator GlxA family with amidase domain